jgi:pimeloyl-ACP methyl ester carboxylesterase
LLEQDKAYAQACQKYSGKILPYVGTVDAARDLDRIRAALGDAKLTYIGHSYGTLLGAVYAQMYPTHVRAMVLDSAIDPALTTTQYIDEQADGLETALEGFFSWCASSSDCGWRPSGDQTSALLGLIDQSRKQPFPAANGQLAGPGEIYDALLGGLESSNSWPTLGNALAEAAVGNGTGVVDITDSYSTGGSTNGGDAEQAIDCLDHPVSRVLTTYPALAAQAASQAPVFGPLLAWGWMGCAMWPVLPTRTPAPTTAAGAPPILVTGTLHDPTTPFQWSASLASELQSGELVTWTGSSHVAYFYSSCVRSIDQAYLISLTLPPKGTVCTD